MTRNEFLKLFLITMSGAIMTPDTMFAQAEKTMPILFVGHGSPMNALYDNAYTKHLQQLGKTLPKPRAILVISAHWTPKESAVSLHSTNELMYDMFGFPDALYEVQYPAPNAEVLLPDIATLDLGIKLVDRKLDHGSWTVLKFLYPDADIPVMQLGINRTFTLSQHASFAANLASLREAGVLIIGSGNITHNLGNIDPNTNAAVFDFAKAFDGHIVEALEGNDLQSLVEIESYKHTAQAHPTLEHYIPLLYIAALARETDSLSYPYEAFEHGSLSMRSVLFSPK